MILIIDDDKTCADTLKMVLEHDNISDRVDTAYSVKDAISLLRANEYQAVVTDYILDDSHTCMDLGDIKSKVIIVSGWPRSDWIKERMNASAFLKKPFDLNELYDKLK